MCRDRLKRQIIKQTRNCVDRIIISKERIWESVECLSNRVDQASFGKYPLKHEPGIRFPSKTDVDIWSTYTYIPELIKYLNYIIFIGPIPFSPGNLTILFFA